VLGFDVETESFNYIGEEDDTQRNYPGELRTLMASQPQRKWWTLSELARKDTDGIGAAEATVKGVLAEHPDMFGKAAGADVGRPRADCVYSLRTGPADEL
jgi:hypothetical protein